MQVTEQQLRAVVLAQAIEQVDTEGQLVSTPEREEATRSAIAAARERGVPRVAVGDIVVERAAAIAARASGRDMAVAALEQPNVRLQWLARALPVAALVSGLAIDRIANAHRVDLLSPPLLLVLAWNLAVYALLAWRAVRPPAPGADAARWLRHRMQAPARHKGRHRGLGTRIAAEFHGRWFASTSQIFLQRMARVLHLCAAAWAAGIALSLLLRGLVVRYQFGWESTFLDAGQVHAIVSVLFWPLTAGFGLEPFSAQEIAATQNFAGEGTAGGRWVWMYVGLLVLVVVLPRLALAAWARWREARLCGQHRIDPDGTAFDALRQAMPGDLVLGLHAADAAQVAAWHGLVAWHAQQGAVHSAQGDRLRFVDAASAAAGQPVDAVLACDAVDAGLAPAWQPAPVLALRWGEFAESWVLEPVLFERLGAVLPRHQQALARLRLAWVQRNEARFEQSLQAIVEYLRAAAAGGPAADHAARVQALDAALVALHGAARWPQAQPAPGDLRVRPANRADETVLALGTTAGAAAGAAAGAKVGALIDVGSGGMTLGAGTALGALLGGTTAWVVRGLQKRGASQELLLRVAEDACTRYLVIAHQARVPAHEATQRAARWQAEVTATVAAYAAALAEALQAAPAPVDPALPLVRAMLLGILRRSFMPEPAQQPAV
jgi:hypothetical protein